MLELNQPEILGFIIAGAFVGGFVNGLASFGTALFTLGFWLQIMPPLQSVSIIMVISATTGLQGFWVIRKTAYKQRKRIARYLVPGLCGIPIGLFCLNYIEAEWLRNGVGVILIAYGFYVLTKTKMPVLQKDFPKTEIAIGLGGGILGGLASLSGAIPSIWLSLQNWPKNDLRALLQSFNLAILSVSAVSLFFFGAYTPQSLPVLMIALPVSIFAAQLGIICFKRLDEKSFKATLVFLMFISGILILAT